MKCRPVFQWDCISGKSEAAKYVFKNSLTPDKRGTQPDSCQLEDASHRDKINL